MKLPADRTARFETFLSQQGRIGQRILAKDWSATTLGPIATWPISLQTTLRLAITTRQPIVLFWGPDYLQFYNEAYQPILDGMPGEAVGAPFKQFWGEVFEGVRPFFEDAIAGNGTWAVDLPLDLTRDGRMQRTYWTFSYSPLYDDDGAISGFLNIVNETTKAVADRQALEAADDALVLEHEKTRQALENLQAAEREQRVLQRELSHRMKNTLAMVQAIVSQSMRHAPSAEEGGRLASERLQALGRAQDSLTDGNWQIADIRSVVDAAIDPHRDRDDRFVLSGPAVELDAQRCMGISLALHELATNATKYGALSNEAGHVQVEWAVEDQAFSFRWSESGGPSVSEPHRRGFGSRLTERVVPDYFEGNARTDYHRNGLVYLLEGRL